MTTTTSAATLLAGPAPVSGHRAAARDWITMLRRNLLHMRRYPGVGLFVVGIPVVLLVLFVYVFGGTLGAGLPGQAAMVGGGGRDAYLAYVTPAIVLMAVAGAAQAVAISVASDMTKGIASRFRTLPISRGSVLAGHVLGGTIESVLACAATLAVAVLLGYRPDAGPAGWLALVAVVTLISFVIIWLGTALGLVAKTVESASNLPMFLIALPFLASGFVPVESMPAGLSWFAAHQPFTPFIETVRGLLSGSVHASDVVATLVWCAVIGAGSYAWSRSLYRREPRS